MERCTLPRATASTLASASTNGFEPSLEPAVQNRGVHVAPKSSHGRNPTEPREISTTSSADPSSLTGVPSPIRSRTALVTTFP